MTEQYTAVVNELGEFEINLPQAITDGSTGTLTIGSGDSAVSIVLTAPVVTYPLAIGSVSKTSHMLDANPSTTNSWVNGMSVGTVIRLHNGSNYADVVVFDGTPWYGRVNAPYSAVVQEKDFGSFAAAGITEAGGQSYTAEILQAAPITGHYIPCPYVTGKTPVRYLKYEGGYFIPHTTPCNPADQTASNVDLTDLIGQTINIRLYSYVGDQYGYWQVFNEAAPNFLANDGYMPMTVLAHPTTGVACLHYAGNIMQGVDGSVSLGKPLYGLM